MMEFSEAETWPSVKRNISARCSNATINRASSSFADFIVDQQSSCTILAYCFILYLLHRCLGSRIERGREREILREHWKQCDVEQDAIKKLRDLEHASVSRLKLPSTTCVPRRPRSVLPRVEKKNSSLKKNSGHFVFLSMSPIGEELCSNFFKQVSNDVIEMHQNHNIVCKLGEVEDHYIAQTQIELAGDVLTTLNKLAKEGLADSGDENFQMQLGRIQIYVRSRDHNNTVELLKLEETDSVPVILYSTYVAGTVTIYGFGLTGANLMLSTLTECIMLEMVGQKGAAGDDGLEKYTCMVTLPSMNITEVFVYATKNIGVQGYDVCVSSLAVSLQDDNWKVVFRNVIPVTIILLYMAKQILWLLYFMHKTTSASVYIWLLLPVLVIILAQFLPQSAELTFRKWCKKTYVRAYLMLYFASRSLIQERDLQILNLSFQNSDSQLIKNCLGGKRSDVPESLHGNTDKGKNKDLKPALKKESSIRNADWQWPIYDRVRRDGRYSLERRTLDVDGKDKESAPFKVTYKNCKHLPWASQVSVDILSPALTKVIGKLIPLKVDMRGQMTVSMDGTEFFFIHQKLKVLSGRSTQNNLDLSSPAPTITTEELLHLKHLLRFLDQELKRIEEMFASMESQRCLSHDMLWAFFPPGEIISYLCNVTEEDLCGIVESTSYDLDLIDRKTVIFYIEISGYNYNCRTWSKYSERLSIRHFDNDLAFDSMKIHPLRFKDNIEEKKEYFLDQGRQFCELSMLERSNFKTYKGPLYKMVYTGGCWQVLKENADGKVMVDLGSFSKMNPGYKLGTARPPCDVLRDNKVDTVDISDEPSRMFSPRMVYGFSFRLKEWGIFSTCGFSDIVFNESAFDRLVMDKTTKELTESVVREHLKGGPCDESERLDPIGAKGDGCIFLCSGPPGTGKTLTAESLAEKLHCPLWSLSVAELGTEPNTLESMLVKVMDVAVQWGALLLLDEADIYLEHRTSSDLERNAMTGVFLRQLEYFRGVIFLTTNRDIAFDEAFCSRISMFLCYEKHNKEQRSKIWESLLDLVGMTDVPSDVLEEFVQYEFNGREIRNVMQTAQTVARSKKEQINYQHIQRSLMVLDTSIKRRKFSNS